MVQASYTYDWKGQQAVRRFPASGQAIQSVFDSAGHRIAEYNEGTGALIRAYVWLGEMPVAVIEGGQVYSVRVDHIGRPSFATTSAGTVVWQMSYLPFGGVNVTTGAPIDLRFPGQWFQTEAGLYQNWMRDYDPTLGRYIEADPLGLVDGASVYGYVRQNPGRWIDPRGEETTVSISYPPDKSWDPGHASVMTDNIIYNPNGDQCACQYLDGDPDAWWPGSGETYSRNSRTDDSFRRHQSSDGWVVHNYVFPTTPEQEREIERHIDEHGGGGYLGCASSVSTVLDGVGPFRDLGHHWRPSSLESALKRLLP